MKNKTNLLTALLIAIVIVASMFVPAMNVFATDYTYTITFTASEGHTFTQDGTHLKIDGNFLDLNNVTFSNPSTGNMVVTVTDSTHATIAVTNGSAGVISYHATPTDQSNPATGFTLYANGSPIMMDTDNSYNTDTQIAVQDYNPASNPNNGGGSGGGDTPQGNTPATVNISGTRSEEARISINGTPYDPFRQYDAEHPFMYNYESGKVTITFASLFIQKYDSISVNGTPYDVGIDYTNREDWLNHYGRQETAFNIEVNKADSYNIVANLSNTDENTTYIGNFLWTGNPADEYEETPSGDHLVNDNYIGHSKLQLVKVAYDRDGTTYTKTVDQFVSKGTENIGDEPWSNYTADNNGNVEYGVKDTTAYDEGSLTVPEGAKVTMKIIPEYGYQVTSFAINGDDVITGDNISEFTFTVNKGNFHLGAKVEAVEDKVEANSEAIASGNITLGGAERAMNVGTAKLEVDDVTNLTDTQKSDFEEKAGDYEIQNYVDISLFNTVYKGTASKTWDTPVSDLSNKATISLKLDENVKGNDFAVIHEKHDGTYEAIDTEYDADTNSITFQTDSFSNYAIASKTVQTNAAETVTEEEAKTSKNPTTGDYIMAFAAMFAISSIGFIVTRKISKRK